MATKEAVFKLRVDTGNSVQDVTNADKAVKSFDTTLKDTQKTAANSTASTSFAQQLEAINEKVNEGGLGFRELSKVIKEYQSIAVQAGEGSAVSQAAIDAAGKLKDRIAELTSKVKVASADFKGLDTAISLIGTGAAVFSGLKSAVTLLGVENENLTKSMVKLQAVQGITNAINQVANALNKDAVLGIQLRVAIEKIKNFVIGDTAKVTTEAAAGEVLLSTANTGVTVTTGAATLALKAFRVALLSTGIGALVVGVGFLIGNLHKLGGFFKSTESAAEKLAETQKLAAKAAREQTEAIAKESSGFLLLASRIKQTTNDSKERKALVSQMNTQYGTTLANLQDEAKFQFAINQEIKNYIAYQTIKIKLQAGEKEFEKIVLAGMDLEKKKSKLIAENQGKELKGREQAVASYRQGFNDIEQDTKIFTNKIEKESNRELDNINKRIEKNELLKNNIAKNNNELIQQQDKLTNGGKKFVEQTVKTTTATEDQTNVLKDNLDVLKNKLEREKEAFEKSKDIIIAMKVDGKNKDLAILEETYGDFRFDLIKRANQDEIKLLDEKFTSGKINEEQYRQDLNSIMQNGATKFSKDEIALMEVATNKFNDDKRRLNLTAQELEIEDANRSLEQKDISEIEHAEKILEINDKYTKIERDKAAKKENDRRASNALLNAIILNETELALVNEELAFKDQKKKLDDLLISTNLDEKITKEQHDAALIELEKKKQKAIIKIKEDAKEKAKQLAIAQFLEDNENLTKFIENAQKVQQFAQEMNSVLNGFADQRLQENANKRDADLANLDAAQQRELSQIGLTDEQKKQIEEKFAIQKYNIQLKAFNAEDKINRAKFLRDKALKMTGIVINTAEAVVKSIANNGGVPKGIPFGIASGILGAAQLAVVASSKYQSGAAPTMPQLSSGGDLSGASGGQLSTPSASQNTTLTSGLPGVSTQTSGQVFVLESDITAVQNTVFVAEAKTKF